MTHREAYTRGLPDGHLVKLVQDEGLQLYLADWDRKPESGTTPCPDSARYFATRSEAIWAAKLADMLTGQKWAASTPPPIPQELLDAAFNEAFIKVFGGDEDPDVPEFARTERGTIRMRGGAL